MDGKWPVCICLALSLSLPDSPDPSPIQDTVTFWPSSHKVSSCKCTVALSCDLLFLIHDAFKKRSRVGSVEVSASICSGLPNWLRQVQQIGGSYHVKLFRASCLSVIQYFWHGLLALLQGKNALCMRESVTKCVKVIWSFLIALTSNFQMFVPGLYE